ncbi:Z1 domain-containing protein [Amycolatopsis sp. 195334CR]|uniref:Z1 domain-containing protein n=1 Tax=Amycolatopsis sp. 195334CR TaxID=2814588 RepID=UPI001A8F6ADE|nr:Z1 domain-containing protein [Amycolatopsis sp. 195334CR]MBN6034038.1 hypothetical protein [Amycolatopsis sp. 195334CR]
MTFVVALRELWEMWSNARISMTSYADSQNVHPATMSRYFNGKTLPPDEIVIDLVDSIRRVTELPIPGEPGRLLNLLNAAQDAQPSNWGALKQWKAREHRQRLRADMADTRVIELTEEISQLRLGFAAGSAPDNDAELAIVRGLLAEERLRVAELEREIAAWRTRATEPASTGIVEVGGAHYWQRYVQSRAERGWTTEAISAVDSATSRVLDQLAEPTASEPSPRRGTVLDHVGGASPDVIGLLAKAIDRGYRLVIVLAGTLNEVRRQVQRAIDEDLVSLPDTPGIVRLTSTDLDYRRLSQDLHGLEFEKRHPELPLHAPSNLHSSSTRIMVVKKNMSILRRLRMELLAMRTPLTEIPALILDLAPDDGTGPKTTQITQALTQALPRGQFVSFSSTTLNLPMQDEHEHFVVASPRPREYVGASDVFGTGEETSGTDENISGERTYVRRFARDDDDLSLRTAMDMFVLTGAVKVYRSLGARHHGLLVATSARVAEQAAMRDRLQMLWQSVDYHEIAGLARLQALFDSDVAPVSMSCLVGAIPGSFDELRPALEIALEQLGDDLVTRDTTPVPDKPWHVTVIGPGQVRLAPRDGTTVLYIDGMAPAQSAPAALRPWFGLRPGYTDLLRLYVPDGDDPNGLYANIAHFWRADSELHSELVRYGTGN